MAILKVAVLMTALFIGVVRSSDGSEDLCRHLHMTDNYEGLGDSPRRNFSIHFKNFETQDDGLPALRELEVRCDKNGCQYTEQYNPDCSGSGLCAPANARSFHCETCHYWSEELMKCRRIRGCSRR